jgi:Uma2 family endonuclease
MVQTSAKPVTLEQFLALPETKPASEFVEGQIFRKNMPQGKHSTLQLRLANVINEAAVPGRIAYAFPELRCTFENRSIVPDLAVVHWQHIPFDESGEVANAFKLAPDWVIEILSPEQSPTRVTDNILFCMRHRTSLGWLIDPAEKAILCFQPSQLPTMVWQSEDLLPVLDGLDLSLKVGQIFELLKLSI